MRLVDFPGSFAVRFGLTSSLYNPVPVSTELPLSAKRIASRIPFSIACAEALPDPTGARSALTQLYFA
jgi:hypothetical protein